MNKNLAEMNIWEMLEYSKEHNPEMMDFFIEMLKDVPEWYVKAKLLYEKNT